MLPPVLQELNLEMAKINLENFRFLQWKLCAWHAFEVHASSDNKLMNLCEIGVFHVVWGVYKGTPRWKINSFLSEISVCWRCAEKLTIQIERAFSVILQASLATCRSFQPLPQRPTVATENLRFNTPLATANARWRLPSHTIVDCIADSSTVCWHKRLLIEVVTVDVY